MVGISIREYARQSNCSDTAVHKAIKAGKIVKGLAHDDKGRPRILPDVATAEWAEFKETNPIVKPIAEKITVKSPPVTQSPGSSALEEPATPTNNLAKARLAQAISRAKLLEQDYQHKKGQLVNKDQVYKALFSAGQEIRATFQAMPDRYIDEIFSAKSRNEAHEILTKVITEALETLADTLKRDLIPRA